jgi:phage tail protein X
MPESKYITSQGQAWDQIAHQRWGSEALMHELMAANPAHRAVVIFPAGVELTIPDVSLPVDEEPPPWQER